jgi:hypothetical protein
MFSKIKKIIIKGINSLKAKMSRYIELALVIFASQSIYIGLLQKFMYGFVGNIQKEHEPLNRTDFNNRIAFEQDDKSFRNILLLFLGIFQVFISGYCLVAMQKEKKSMLSTACFLLVIYTIGFIFYESYIWKKSKILPTHRLVDSIFNITLQILLTIVVFAHTIVTYKKLSFG